MSASDEDIHLKIETQIEHRTPIKKNAKSGQNGSPEGNVTYLSKLWPPISWERLKLETRYLARRLSRRVLSKKICKIGSRGPCGAHVTYIELWTRSISREWLKLETWNLPRIFSTRGTIRKMPYYGNGVVRNHLIVVMHMYKNDALKESLHDFTF